jgi:hypothetical protein
VKKPKVHVERGDYWIKVTVNGTIVHEHHALDRDGGVKALVEALGGSYTESGSE